MSGTAIASCPAVGQPGPFRTQNPRCRRGAHAQPAVAALGRRCDPWEPTARPDWTGLDETWSRHMRRSVAGLMPSSRADCFSGLLMYLPAVASGTCRPEPSDAPPTRRRWQQTGARAPMVACRPAQRSAAQCGAVRCGAVRCGAVRCGAVRCSAVQCRLRERCAEWRSTLRRWVRIEQWEANVLKAACSVGAAARACTLARVRVWAL